ncbi:MAG: SLC13 family permease [Candidatus Aminicenantales bacterium]
MTVEVAALIIVLVLACLFLLTGWLSSDLVAILILVVLMFAGILEAEEAFAGFGSPLIIAVASLFIVSGGLHRTGVSGLIGRHLQSISGKTEARTVATVMVVGALLSSVITNVAATAILLPAAMALSLRSGLAPSKLLMPLSFGTILGGTLTLVGSQPNVIVSSMLKTAEGKDLGFFAITPIGLTLTILGIIYMTAAGRRFLPVRHADEKIRRAVSPEALPSIYRLDERFFELKVPPGSRIVGRTLEESRLGSVFGINVISILRPGLERFSPLGGDVLRTEDRLLVQGREEDIGRAAAEFDFEVCRRGSLEPDEIVSGELGIAEVVLPPRSLYGGKKLRDILMRERLGLTVLAIWRGGRPIRARLGEETLQLGDALLIRGPWSKIRLLAATDEFIVVSGIEASHRPERRGKMLISAAILGVLITSVVAGALPLSMAALSAAALMILTRCLSLADAYRAIEWRMIVLIGGFISLGTALAKTGAIDLFVEGTLVPLSASGRPFVLGAVFVLTWAVALVTSNVTAAVLMGPVALSTAAAIGLSPQTMLICVAIGASNGFMTPVGQQANLLVMGPGNYVPGDYLKSGFGLSLLVFFAAMAFFAVVGG